VNDDARPHPACALSDAATRPLAGPVVPVCAVEALPAGQRKLVFHDGRSYVVFNLGGVLRAIENSCPHQGASLASGKVERQVLHCPAHGLGFDLMSGCVRGAAGLSLKLLTVRVADGRIELLPEAAEDAVRRRETLA
jgi:3-phenylpropionate/trans-cinnamate dioxygenase ferredoxin component